MALLFTALAVLVTLAVRPELMNHLAGAGSTRSSDGSYDWSQDTAAEQLRQDQCLMSDVLRLGGPAMAGIAQDGLNQEPDKLHSLADREHWQRTPLATAYDSDRKAYGKEEDSLSAARKGWQKPLDGLTTPAGFTEGGFHLPPGSSGDDGESFHAQTGLSKWVSDRFWKQDDDFYEDPTPRADEKTVKAVKDLGAPLYGTDPAPGLPPAERERALAEQDAFQRLSDFALEPMGADNARIFLASGGFPRTAPEPDTAEFRIAVEDMKTRFAACAWRDAMDPSRVLGEVSGTAAKEWQQEIASQAEQRNQILNANKDATTALTNGSKALGELLGQSWIADHLARWQDYWTPGGAGWIGDKPAIIEVHAAQGRCLDVQSAGKNDGAPVQIWPCNGSPAQKWRVYGDDRGLHLQNTNSQKCLDVENNNPANGTRIQIWACNSSPAQTWEYDLRATTALKNVGTGKCLDLHTYEDGYNSWLYSCNGTDPQKFTIKPTGHDGVVPPKAQFDQATKGIAAARTGAKTQLAALKAQAAAAKKAATTTVSAEQAAYKVADDNGAPRGRGLLVGQQKSQVTQGAAAALEAMVKAGETAEAATRASGGDSQTIAQRALAQAAQSKAEFRKEAAHIAELQAKAASESAKEHRDNAKKDKETAEAKLAETEQAEADAKAAASTAHAKRLAAEAEEATAKEEKETAEAKQAEAARHKTNAQTEAGKAKEAKEKAEDSESTAVSQRNTAKKASDKARDLRDDAWDAEQKADTARTKADAKEAYAQSLEAGDAATEARKAADAADKHATDAETAATKARSEADAATEAAADADAAATRAEAAAKRARSNADAAEAAKLKADAAVKTATSAAADAIQAAKDAAYEAGEAVKEANKAEKLAKSAKSHADEAKKQAGTALAASAKAAGYAHTTAQAAVDAGNAAAQVAKPANDAIQIGSPYTDTDNAASLVVLTGQSSKTIAEQQQAVADAHANNAGAEAQAAKDIAAQAQGDAKAAYQHAANAAGYAATARGYAKQALGYAADASKAAAKAAKSLARTIEYDKQATEDAAAADRAAGRAEGYAKQARDSADQAALDAQAARDAAAEAEQAASDARAAAKRADEAATEAEQYAKDARKYAKEAQEAHESAQRKQANKQVSTGAGTGIGGTFYVVDSIDLAGDPKQKNPCELDIGFGGCTVTFTLTFNADVSFYLCTNPEVPASESGCPKSDTVFLGTQTFKGLTKDVTRYFTKLEIAQDIVKVIAKLAWDILVQDFVDCWHGSVSGCGWAAANFIPGKKIEDAVQAIKGLDRALRSGDDIADAWNSVRGAGLSDDAVAGISQRALTDMENTCAKSRVRATRALVRAANGGGGYCKWLEMGGPGKWMPETESMSPADRAYEQLVTEGVPSGISYKVPADTPSGFVKFDGYQNGTLIDAKNQHYSASMLTADGKLKFPTKETTTMVKQVKAAKGTPVVWYMSDEKTRYALQQWALDNDVKGIKFVFRAGQV
ncbi:RICIN domain-containing protein [Streptomyces sp. NPDC059009]|uniref:RICIN domain-containing protein n=1 Tax=Streptomyces sp. NPDC059009 TaxID=3346694 RepID=UPI0036C12816